MSEAAPRRIWLCADDYGISPGVNRAIRDLIERRRINATSVMVVGPAIGRDEVRALNDAMTANPECAIGLHATLTAPFCPLTMHFRPLHGGLFLPLGKKLQAGLLRRFDREIIAAELTAQIAAFVALFGRVPDYVDGHQHVQLFPQVRDAFLTAVQAAAPNAWVRQCGRVRPLAQRLGKPKALLLDVLSVQFRARAARAGVAFNSGFAGAYDFHKQTDFAALMGGFLEGLPDGGLVMCHPGHVDDTLISLDHFTHQREREHAFLAGDQLLSLLAASNVVLAAPTADPPASAVAPPT
ncbi:MAG: ChbG/HpnK family deacetylase [Rhodopseudomonas sp.]|uniref:ChbG/HpnK family deacetylase n=1 Tax=Rhodopseudomonas sp. TaxID=1078 RepID=UPI0017B4C41F|nr:ChbG/HpnK family deacetylase [Rhodopseudomonas sp.]NVN85154.1 ChbG/HpnK family deacetylase [Rhodopseudomonas sp.]